MRRLLSISFLILSSWLLMGLILAPDPKSETEKAMQGDFIERSEDELIYNIRVYKNSSDALMMEAELFNISQNIVKISPDIFNASEAEYSLRHVPLDEILASYQGAINYQMLRFQNTQQSANMFASGSATTTYYGNSSQTNFNVGPNPYALLGMAIVGAQTQKRISQAQDEAQNLINISFAPISLMPKTRYNGVIFFKRKGNKGPVRIDVVINSKILSFNFKDVPYFGVDFSDSPVLVDLDLQGTLGIAGLKNEDKLLSIDGQKVSSVTEFVSIGRKYPIGKPVTIEFQRHKKIKSVIINLVGPPY